MQQPLVNGIRIYMALKGSGGAGAVVPLEARVAAQRPAAEASVEFRRCYRDSVTPKPG